MAGWRLALVAACLLLGTGALANNPFPTESYNVGRGTTSFAEFQGKFLPCCVAVFPCALCSARAVPDGVAGYSGSVCGCVLFARLTALSPASLCFRERPGEFFFFFLSQ